MAAKVSIEFRDKAAYEADPVAELTRVYVNGVKRLKASEDEEDEGGSNEPAVIREPDEDE